VVAIRSGWAIGVCPGFFECLASTIFCAIIATGYSQDLEFQGWAGAGQNDESNDACLMAVQFGIQALACALIRQPKG
jgi:hypothetical protein